MEGTQNTMNAIPQEGQASAPNNEEMMNELRDMKGRELEWIFQEDLAKIKKAFPNENVQSIPELGENFLKMRSIGIDAVVAYASIMQAKNAGKSTPPPSIGPVNAAKPGAREFFSADEVRRMNPQQIAENLKKIEKSQKNW